MSAAEEARALAYREQEARRCQAIASRRASLRGSASARRTLDDHWRPILDALTGVENDVSDCQTDGCEDGQLA